MQKKNKKSKKKFLTLWPLGKGGLDLEIFWKFQKIEFFCCCSKWLKMVSECKKTQNRKKNWPYEPLVKGVWTYNFFENFKKLKKYFFAQNGLKCSPHAKNTQNRKKNVWTLWPLGKGSFDLFQSRDPATRACFFKYSASRREDFAAES